MFSKISVKGPDRHPLYDALIGAKPEAEGADAMREKLAGYGVPAGGQERCPVELREVPGGAGRDGGRAVLAGHSRHRSPHRQGGR
ncbi:MAG: hypothetical protein WDN45_09275 [Caulobacteraceae bacterium]